LNRPCFVCNMFGFLGDNVNSVKQAAEVGQAKTVDVSSDSKIELF
jgi:hypothetical protein